MQPQDGGVKVSLAAAGQLVGRLLEADGAPLTQHAGHAAVLRQAARAQGGRSSRKSRIAGPAEKSGALGLLLSWVASWAQAQTGLHTGALAGAWHCRGKIWQSTSGLLPCAG